jgi:hypothetical protein
MTIGLRAAEVDYGQTEQHGSAYVYTGRTSLCEVPMETSPSSPTRETEVWGTGV